MVEYAAFTPHASFTYRSPAGTFRFPAVSGGWHKWRPRDPTSPHWYSWERLRDLIAAYLKAERSGGQAKTVRDFIGEFRGLSSTVKRKEIMEAAGLSGYYLHDLIDGDQVAEVPVGRLLDAMQKASKPVKPADLGVLGATFLRDYLTNSREIDPETFGYRKLVSVDDAGIPFVLEVAFGAAMDAQDEEEVPRRSLVVGVNWAPALTSPFPRLGDWLGERRIALSDPVTLLVHLVYPRPSFLDRGKTQLALPSGIEAGMWTAIEAVTLPWYKAKREEDQKGIRARKALEAQLTQQRREHLTVKAAAYRVMADAYRQASGSLGLANARQIMYKARPMIIALTGKDKPWSKSSTFTQGLLVDFQREYPDLTADWDVVYDDRGHFTEPHTDKTIGLGTVAVRQYIASWHSDVERGTFAPHFAPYRCETRGPAHRYAFALFVEKEGFDRAMAKARIADRYDLALMSTKGMSVTAARRLVEQLSEEGVTILVIHDFDKSGLSIVQTLGHDTPRYQFKTPPKVIDLGVRLADVHAMGLQSEAVPYEKNQDPRPNLRQNGATEEEVAFLVRQREVFGYQSFRWHGERVELDAMGNDELIAWLEGKLTEYGVQKILPDQEILESAFREATLMSRTQKVLDDAQDELTRGMADLAIPKDLAERIQAHLQHFPAESWDQALRTIVEETP